MQYGKNFNWKDFVKQQALNQAMKLGASDNGMIWDDTQAMPLLYDDIDLSAEDRARPAQVRRKEPLLRRQGVGPSRKPPRNPPGQL